MGKDTDDAVDKSKDKRNGGKDYAARPPENQAGSRVYLSVGHTAIKTT